MVILFFICVGDCQFTYYQLYISFINGFLVATFKGETFSARQKTVADQLLPITKNINRVSNMGDR